MKRGTRPTPTALAKLRGNPGHRSLNPNEPMPKIPKGMQAAPPWLEDEGLELYERFGPVLHRLKLLTEADYNAFTKYCEIYKQWSEARDHLRNHGAVQKLKTRHGYRLVTSPYVAIARNLLAAMQKYEVEFGMTPSARTRLSVTKVDEEYDPVQAFLGENPHAVPQDTSQIIN